MNNERDRIVTTFDGTRDKRSNCRFIKGEFYSKNTQCFYLNDKWIRVTSKYIVKDWETNQYYHVDNSDHLFNGIISFDKSNYTTGKFSGNPLRNCKVYFENDEGILCLDHTMIDQKYFIETNKGFVEKDLYNRLPSRHPLKNNTLNGFRIGYNSLPFEYNTDHVFPTYNRIFDKIANTIKIKSEIELDHSYGVEYETFDGYIPEYRIFNAGLIPLRDGSLRHNDIQPYEYATIPMQGKDALGYIEKQCKLLNIHCSLDAGQSSLHVHQGAHSLTFEYVVAYYSLILSIQDELYSLFPDYIRHSFELKGKDYCNSLPTFKELENYFNNGNNSISLEDKVKEKFIYIYYFLCHNNIYGTINAHKEEYFFKNGHPADPDNRRKWGVDKRYYLVNFIPLLFNNKRTIEWRMHTPTFNYYKIKYYLMLIEATAKFVDNHSKDIITENNKYTLKDIISDYWDYRNSDILNKYFEYRKKNYTKYNIKGNKKVDLPELKEDSTFVFE